MTMRLPLHIAALVLALGVRPAFAAAAACSNPGKDGPASISGIVNSYYAPSSSVSAGSISLPLGAVDVSSGGASTAITAGDLVLVIQMQDADINGSNSSAYGGSSPGSGQTALNNAGVYEYVTVAQSYLGGSPLPITAPLTNSYRLGAYAAGANGQRTYQIIRVPQYSSATLAGTVTAAPWNGVTGGVVVFDVAGALSWSGQTIDVVGRGFRGGGGLYLKGRDPTQPAYSSTDYVSTLAPLAPVILPNPSSAAGPFPGSNGSKGEGIAGTPRYLFVPSTVGVATNAAGAVFDTGVEGYPNGSLARGAPANAGGGGTDGDPQTANAGGNDQNTGGGGGGGYAAGGMGGYGWTPGTPPGSQTGGFGGEGVALSAARLTQGGGGGAGSSNNGTGTPNYALASSGAPGGGIVMVRAKTIAGSGTINANGTAGNQSVCNDASGGGGGGGAVLVFASGNNGNVGTLVVNASGGMGGSNTGNGTAENSGSCGAYNNQPHGPGGGGGGGFVALSSISSATINVAGSANGTTSPSATSTAPYGSSSSPGGFQISSVVSTDIPGSQPSPLCYPLLTVSKVTGKANTVQGATTSYTITVSNAAGYGIATGVALSDVLPAPFTLASTDTIAFTNGAKRTAVVNPAVGAAAPSWSAFTIPAGGSVALAFTANLPAATALATYQNPANAIYDDPTRAAAGQTVTPGGTYQAGGFVLGSNYDPASSAQEDVTVRQPASISKGFSPVSVVPGGTTQLNILITNPNAVALTSAAFTDSFPPGMTAVGGAVSVTGSGCTGFGPASVAASATSLSQSGGTVPANGTCTFSLNVVATGTGSSVNTLPPGAFANNLNVINTAAGTGTLLVRPGISKAFSPLAVPTNTNATLTFTVTNPNAGTALTNASFTDSFPGGLVASGGAVTTAGGCSGFPASIAAGATVFNATGGTLPAGSTCTISFAVKSATQGSYLNTAGGVTTTETGVAGAGSNGASLGVGVIGISKQFTPSVIAPNGTSTVTLTLTNPTGVAQANGSLTDTLTGMSISGLQTAGGTCYTVPPTLANGAISLSFTAIPIAAAGCTITFVVKSATVGTQLNTTSGVTTPTLGTGPASNTAQLVVAGPPTVSKSFTPSTIQTGGTSTITFTLLDGDSIPLTGAAFTDTLNVNLEVAGSGSVAAGGTCAGAGSNSFVAGTAGATLSFTGLGIPTGAGGCTVTIPVTSSTLSPAAGYANTTSGVSSNEAATGAASNTANLIVVASPSISKAFATSPIAQGGTSVLTFTLTNPSAIALTGGAFTDTLTGMSIAAAGAAGGTCTGASGNSFAAAQTSLAFTGLTLPASPATCTVTVTVTSSTAGTNTNTASGVTTTQTPVAGAQSNTANLVVYSPPALAVGFTPGIILSTAALASSTSTLTITLSNSNAVALTGVAFTDALTSMQIATTGAAGGTCTGASGNSFTAGNTSLSFSGLTVPASGSCTVTVSVSSASLSPASGWPDSTSGATSTQTPTAGPGSPAGYLGVVTYATLTKSFNPDAIPVGGTSTLTFTLANTSSINLTGAKFSDTFPGGMTTINAAQTFIGGARGTCTGAIPSAKAAGTAGSVSFAGILIPANSSCTVLVDVTASAAGSYSNTASGVIAVETFAAAGPVSNTATLGVGQVGIAKQFAPATVGVGDQSTLTFTITNGLNSAFNNIVIFTDTFPAGLKVATPLVAVNNCGGTLRNVANTANTAAGDTGLSLQNGTIAALATCTITIKVSAPAGSYSNTTGTISWGAGAGNTGPASNTAVLTVVAKPTIAKAFNPTSLDAYRNSLMTFTLNNPNASASLTGCSFTDTLTGFAVSSPPSIGGTCVGVTNSPALAAGSTALNLTIPTLNPGSCTITLPVTSGVAGTYNNTSSGVVCNELVSAGAVSNTAAITFNKVPIQIVKSANLANVPPGSTVTYTITYTNPNPGMPLQNIVITDATPQYTTFVSASCGALPASLTSCTVTSPAVGAAGTVTWTLGGSLNGGAASGTLTLTVTVN